MQNRIRREGKGREGGTGTGRELMEREPRANPYTFHDPKSGEIDPYNKKKPY